MYNDYISEMYVSQERKLLSSRQRANSTNSSRQLTRQTTFLLIDNNFSSSVEALSHSYFPKAFVVLWFVNDVFL